MLAQDAPTRTQRATPEIPNAQPEGKSTVSPKEPIVIVIEEKVLLHEVLKESVGNQPEYADWVDGDTNSLELNNQVITVKEKLNLRVDEENPSSAKTEPTDEVESDCAMRSGGRSSFSVLGLLLAPLTLYVWRRIRKL